MCNASHIFYSQCHKQVEQKIAMSLSLKHSMVKTLKRWQDKNRMRAQHTWIQHIQNRQTYDDFQKGSGQGRHHTMPQRNIGLSVGTIRNPNFRNKCCKMHAKSHYTVLQCTTTIMVLGNLADSLGSLAKYTGIGNSTEAHIRAHHMSLLSLPLLTPANQ